MKFSRRNFLLTTAGVSANSFFAAALTPIPQGLPLSSNSFNWITFFSREGREWGSDWDACFKEYTRCGLLAIEPGFSSMEEKTAVSMSAVEAHKQDILAVKKIFSWV